MQSIRMAAVCRLPVEEDVVEEDAILSSRRETACFFRLICPENGSRDEIPGAGVRGAQSPLLRKYPMPYFYGLKAAFLRIYWRRR